MYIPHLTRLRFVHHIGWALLLSALIVSIAATLARATLSLNAAATDKPDLAIFLLLKDEHVTSSILLRENADPGNEQRDYLVETKNGAKLVQLKKTRKKWFVAKQEPLHSTEETVMSN